MIDVCAARVVATMQHEPIGGNGTVREHPGHPMRVLRLARLVSDLDVSVATSRTALYIQAPIRASHGPRGQPRRERVAKASVSAQPHALLAFCLCHVGRILDVM